MSQSVAYKHLLRALSQWPKDYNRPDRQFQDIMQRRLERRFLPSEPTPDARKDVGSTSAPEALVSETYEMEQANTLYSLLENRYMNAYPMSREMLNPKSNPTQYNFLLRELEEAPNRSWFQRFRKKWETLIRLK